MTAYNQGDPRQKIQLCDLCDQPTGSCEEDHVYNLDPVTEDRITGPVCNDCYKPVEDKKNG